MISRQVCTQYFTNLKGALITSETCPVFTQEENRTKYGDVYYAVLKTNESFNTAVKDNPGLKLDGSYVGIGFGASFLALQFFFSDSIQKAIMVDREPYVYLMGKIILYALEKNETFEEFVMCLINFHLFDIIYKEVVAGEPDISPVFIRLKRAEMLKSIPEQIHILRSKIFERKDKEAFFKKLLLAPDDKQLISIQTDYIKDHVVPKSLYNLRLFSENYPRYRAWAREKIIPLCADFFHPDFWSFLADNKDWFLYPSMFYFSNAYMYTKGSLHKTANVATSSPYSKEVIEMFLSVTCPKNYFLFTDAHKFYQVKLVSKPPDF